MIPEFIHARYRVLSARVRTAFGEEPPPLPDDLLQASSCVQNLARRLRGLPPGRYRRGDGVVVEERHVKPAPSIQEALRVARSRHP